MNTTSVDNAALLTTIDRVATAFSRLRGIKEGLVTGNSASGIQFDEWDWEVGVGLYGFLRRAISTNDQKALQELVAWYAGQIERGLPPRQINSTAPMLPLAILVQHVDRPDFRALVEDWAEWLVKELPKTEDGGFQPAQRHQGRSRDGKFGLRNPVRRVGLGSRRRSLRLPAPRHFHQ
jgi:unsaturated rhamnogalacturonyl hydrolase